MQMDGKTFSQNHYRYGRAVSIPDFLPFCVIFFVKNIKETKLMFFIGFRINWICFSDKDSHSHQVY